MEEQYRIADQLRKEKLVSEQDRNEAVKEIEKLHQLIEEMDKSINNEQKKTQESE